MALDRERQLKEAERLLKQGKAQSGLQILQKVAATASRDLAVQNRIGDILARNRRTEEALLFYRKIADQFTQSGFYPKAVAILKKVLRLQPEDPDALMRLGDLYLSQRLHGEARAYLLRAAEKALEDQDLAMARKVFERLVESEPSEPGHRMRLAEILGKEGESERAGAELLAVAESLASDEGRREERERAYRRAADLLPERLEPILGVARCLAESGRTEEARTYLDGNEKSFGEDPEFLGEKAVLLEAMGESDQASELLSTCAAGMLPAGVVERVARLRVERDGAGAWTTLDPLLSKVNSDGLPALLERLARQDGESSIGALERLLEVRKLDSSPAVAAAVARRLVEAYRGASREDDAEALESSIASADPRSAAHAQPVGGDASTGTAPTPSAADGSSPSPPPEEDLPIEAEAPAVPLSKSDEEFVTGRLTQCEILEKYGLLDKAIEQVREVTVRFPGHVEAQRKRVSLLREKGAPRDLASALVEFALALRAAGEHAEARKVARSASHAQAADPDKLRILRGVGLIEERAVAREPAASVSPPVPPAAESREPTPATEAEAPAPPEAVAPFDEEDDPEGDIVIDLEGEPGSTDGAGAPDLEEARFYLDQGMVEEARGVLARLRESGSTGPEIDALESELGEAPDAKGDEDAAPAARAESGPVASASPPARPDSAAPERRATEQRRAQAAPPEASENGGSDDLAALAAALDQEVFLEDGEAETSPEASAEQSLEEVFAAFKEQVEQEVDADDFRTHYDLGIAFKEMGLLDEAIGEFEQAAGPGGMAREAWVMLAMCHRDAGRLEEAADWYRKAIESPGDDGDSSSDLRYDLAEVLLQRGDTEAALDCFRVLAQADPKFRDVRSRIDELEKSIGS